MFPARVPNPFDDDAQRTQRLEAHTDVSSRRGLLVFIGGWIVLVAFGLLALMGLPGTGVVLVPIGLIMILGSGIELVARRFGS